MSVVIETTIGDITVDLFTEERPVTCLNFIKLCQLKYYNFNLFHTIEQGFIAQTGDPSGTGNEGSSVWGVVEGIQKRFFEAESLPKINHTSAGLLSLVSAGKNLVASQFFFTLGANLTSLDGVHCVIGEVVEGHETLRKLNEAIVDDNFRPYQDIRITHTVVLDDPFPNPRGYRVPSHSPSPSAERLKNGRIAADEDIDDTDGKTMQEIHEMLAEREAKARATILEIVGDLPDADMAPPENVLFVCKLNPVTTDDDLEIIFSRFGKVKTCEVIRDRKTGDSLQYAFVEFEEKKSCEAAYFKMDNVLIDDRRIHVDFSQSVSKVKWRGKGRGVEGQDGRLDFNNLRGDTKSSKTGDRDRRGQRTQQRDQQQQRPRMTSEERRREREKRHRLQEEEEKAEQSKRREQQRRIRSRSRSRSPPSKQPSRYGHHNNNRQADNRWQQERRSVRDNGQRNEHRQPQQQQRHRHSRSPSRERAPRRRGSSTDRRNPPQRYDDPRHHKNDVAKREQSREIADRKRHRTPVDREKSNGHADDSRKRHASREKQAVKRSSKKSKRHASKSDDDSGETSEDDSTDTDSDDDSTSEESDSSSEEERKKKKSKKKGKKSHKHKSKSSKKKKKKKHHR